jgi:hypothetical protein
LGQRRPKEFYRRSAWRLPHTTRPWKYRQGISTKYVGRNGAVRWGASKWVVVSTTLIERYVGLEEIVKRKWRVYYRDTLLGYLDEKDLCIQDQLCRLLKAAKQLSGYAEKSVDDVLIGTESI